jgi:hypothetical protein
MYSIHIDNIQHLKQPISEAAVSVTADVLGRVWKEMECRLAISLQSHQWSPDRTTKHVKKLFEFFNLIHIHKYLIPLNIIF